MIRRELLGLCIGVTVLFSVLGMIMLLVPLTATDRGASPRLVGIVISVMSAGSFFIAIPAGLLTRRIPTRTLIVVSCAAAAALFVAISFTTSVAALAAGMFAYRMVEVVLVVALQAHVANLGAGCATRRDSGSDFGWYGFAAAIGQFVGPFAAGLLIDRFSTSITWVFASIPVAICAPAFRLLIGRGHAPQTLSPPHLRDVRRVIRPFPVFAMTSSFVTLFAWGARTAYFPLFLRQLAFSATLTGFLVSLRALSTIASRAVIRPFVRNLGGPVRAIFACLALMFVGVLITPWFTRPWGFALSSVLVGIAMGMVLPIAMGIMADSVPAEFKGLALSVRLTANRGAHLTNPLFYGFIAGWQGVGATFGWAALAVAIGTLGLALMNRRGKLSGTPPQGV